jgi:adenosylmethionine-8-amino-7-oxononanoate aminotransferase
MGNSLIERDKQVIWHPYTQLKFAADPIPILRAEGVFLIDGGGNSYIDAISSWWVNLHGHAHPYIAEKIYKQAKVLEHVIFAGFTHEPAVSLAERILKILPGEFSKVFYSDNGSTAVEVAIKMAVQYWWNVQGDRSLESGVRSRDTGYEMLDAGDKSLEPGARKADTRYGMQDSGYRDQERESERRPRNKILALTNSYHGDTFGAMSVSDRGIFTVAFQDKLFEVIFIDPNRMNVDKWNELKAFTIDHSPLTIHHSPLTIPFDEIACFIYEPLIQGAGAMKMYEPAALDKLLKVFREHEIICIADEVMTGFGRTGKLFASEYMQYKPDIICLSKGLTGGTLPLGITACTEKIYNAFVSDDRVKTFFHGHSFTANPLSCTAALASLDLLQEQTCIDNINGITKQHQRFLDRVKNHQRTKNHRQLGTILAFEINSHEDDQYLNNISPLVTQKGLSKGVFLRPLGNTLYIMPPFCITEIQLQKVYDTIIEILNEL